MTQLIIESPSDMDENLEAEFEADEISTESWILFLKSLPYVKDAEWIDLSKFNKWSHTVVTFETEAHKTWFILRWS